MLKDKACDIVREDPCFWKTPKPMQGHIYIIQVREFIGTSIYKVGRTNDLLRRFKQYPKQSRLLYNSHVNNCLVVENVILEILNTCICREYGREYVDIEFEKLTNIISNVINLYNHITTCITTNYTVLCNEGCCGNVSNNIECYQDQLIYLLSKHYDTNILDIVIKQLEKHKEIQTRECFYYGKVITFNNKSV